MRGKGGRRKGLWEEDIASRRRSMLVSSGRWLKGVYVVFRGS